MSFYEASTNVTGEQTEGQAGVRVQDESPPDVPLWYAGCFELKAALASGSKETSAPLLTTWKNFN